MTIQTPPTRDSSQPIIRAEGIVKRFGKETVALDGVSISIMPGIIYGLLGPNGAGKTTLIRILTTLLDPDAGNAWIEGVDVVADPVTVRRSIGLAGQSAAVDELPHRARERGDDRPPLRPPGAEATPRAATCCDAIHLAGCRRPPGDAPTRAACGGASTWRPRWWASPQVLFLDEPTTGIDPRSRLDVWDIIRDLVAGGTDPPDHHPVPRGGRLPGRLHRGHRPREADRRGHRRRDEGPHRQQAVIEMRVPDDQRERAIALLRDVSHGNPCSSQTAAPHLVHAPEGSRTMMEAVRRLNEAGLPPDDLAMHKPTLDDVFLTLTGRVTESAAQAEGEGQAPAGGRARSGRRRPR